MSNRSRFRARDQRTTRLERAVSLIEDGYHRGLTVKRGTDDPPHPLDQPVTVGLDRVTLKAGRTYKEVEQGATNFVVGFLGDDRGEGPSGHNMQGANWERAGIGSVMLSSSGGTFTFFDQSFGYGEGTYGQYGYGGVQLPADEAAY